MSFLGMDFIDFVLVISWVWGKFGIITALKLNFLGNFKNYKSDLGNNSKEQVWLILLRQFLGHSGHFCSDPLFNNTITFAYLYYNTQKNGTLQFSHQAFSLAIFKHTAIFLARLYCSWFVFFHFYSIFNWSCMA